MEKNYKIISKKNICRLLIYCLVALNTIPILAIQNQNINIKTTKDEWTMIWNDEFNGKELDTTKWTYDLGNWIVDENGNGVDKGWGNNELQNYTKDNVDVENGNLIITAKKEQTSDEYGTYNYTSSRIKTKGLFAKKYGRFEARIALPSEQGLWPAFWMLPEDDAYGGWAASGEIDIMEARGRINNEIEGTIHYGGVWPENKSSGKKYTFNEGENITQFHEYAIEWEPGEIRWYVDDKLYQVQNNWYTKGIEGEEQYSFPAPFDQEFHLLLNLAVGGWFDNAVEPEESFTEASMLVDYVRVYELTGRDYIEAKEPIVEKDPLPDNAKKPLNGNYIYDINFEEGFDNELSSEKWGFLTNQFGGIATINTEKLNGINFAKVDIMDVGQENYSTQLIQYVPIVKGRTYKISYDAKANGNRNISMKVAGGEDRGWSLYSDTYSSNLTTEVNRYEHTFTMPKDTDINARLEFNLGLNSNSVWIGNVVVEEVDSIVDYNGPKEPLQNGNYIYNGTFDKGLIDRKTYWNLEKVNEVQANYSVDENTRELFIDINNGGTNISDVSLNQKGIKLEQNGKYTLFFDARVESENNLDKNINIVIKDSNGEIVHSEKCLITNSNKMNQYMISFDIIDKLTDKNGMVEFQIGGDSISIYLDNVLLTNSTQSDTNDTPFVQKTITSMVATQGPIIDVESGMGTGFTFPVFNGGASTFNDIKDDLQILIKEDGQYIEILKSSKWIYDKNWGYFWDGPGGYWFNPVTETTNIKLVSKTNEKISIEYTLNVNGGEDNNIDSEDNNTSGVVNNPETSDTSILWAIITSIGAIGGLVLNYSNRRK